MAFHQCNFSIFTDTIISEEPWNPGGPTAESSRGEQIDAGQFQEQPETSQRVTD